MSNDTSPAPDYKYWAFISYSHQDNLLTRGDGGTDHIQWANWLHEQLETFRVPDGYRDRPARTGEPMPERFFPTFRDEAELPTSHDLGGQIRDALERSRFLIVIASPRSASSRYVNEEVRYFRELGRGDRILVLITDGEPNVRLHPKAGWTAADDCFCPALVHPLKADGTVDDTQLLREELIAADVRVKDIDPPREMHASESTHDDGRGVLDFMKLKLIAGLMGVGLDELVQRDKRRAEEQMKHARRELSRTEFLFARQLLDLKDYAKANARLAKAIINDSENRAAVTLGLNQAIRGNRGSLIQFTHGNSVQSAIFSPCGSKILTVSCGECTLWDPISGERITSLSTQRDQVVSANFSPDGEKILTTSANHTANLWSASSGDPIALPLLEEKCIDFAAFSPDGTKLLIISREHALGHSTSVFVCDAFKGHPLTKAMRHERQVTSAIFSPDGQKILTSSCDAAYVWNAASGDMIVRPLLHQMHFIRSLAFSSDGTRILTGSAGYAAHLWDATTGDSIFPLLKHNGEVFSAVFSPDNGRILTASGDHTARLWDAATGEPIASPLLHDGGVVLAAFSPDGRLIVTSSRDATARIWNGKDGKLIARPLCHWGAINSAVFSPDGTRVLTASNDNTAGLWDAPFRAHAVTIPLRHSGRVNSAIFNPSGDRILSASDDHTAKLWDASRGICLATLTHKRAVRSAVFSPDGMRILTASEDGTARIWDAVNGCPVGAPFCHQGWVFFAIFSPDGSRIITLSGDGTARFWDALSGKPFEMIIRHDGYIKYVACNKNGTRILITSGKNEAKMWDTTTGRPLGISFHHEKEINTALFCPNGTLVLTASQDSTARLWDSSNGKLVLEPLRHKGDVNLAVFSPDGRLILTASQDNTARIWDSVNGRATAEPLKHKSSVLSAVFSQDGKLVVTCSEDGTAKIWDVISGELIDEIHIHEFWINSTVFSQDSARILTSSQDNTCRIWHAATDESVDNELLRQTLEVTSRSRVDSQGLMELVSEQEKTVFMSAIISRTGCDMFFRWWWSDPFTRTINPYSAITVPDYVRRRIREILDLKDEEAKPRCLQDARDAFLNHPLVLLCEAEQDKCSDPVWLRQHAVSRLLAEPHYLIPLEPPNAIGDAKANRQYELTLGLAEDCFLGARLLLNDRTGQTRITDPKRIELAKQVLARAMKLAPENEAYWKLAGEL